MKLSAQDSIAEDVVLVERLFVRNHGSRIIAWGFRESKAHPALPRKRHPQWPAGLVAFALGGDAALRARAIERHDDAIIAKRACPSMHASMPAANIASPPREPFRRTTPARMIHAARSECLARNLPMEAATAFRYRSFALSVHAGKGALEQLRSEVDRARAKRAFVICGKSVATRSDLVARTRESLADKFAGVFDGVETSSPLPSVLKGVAAARAAEADLIVAIGGGSAMVTARAIVILLAEKGDIHDICTQYPPGQAPVSPRLMAPKIPNILVLTTPSTAMTRAGTAVMDTETRHRLELFDPKTRPFAMIWDDDALATAPAELYLSTAASAFSGILTGAAAPRTNPVSHGDFLQALRLSLESLPLMRTDPHNPTARMNLVAASFLSNRALDGMRGRAFGIISSLGHVIDTLYENVTHGDSYSLCTAWGLRFNLEHAVAGLARLAQGLGVANGVSPTQAAQRAADFVEDFYRRLGMPVRLRDAGIAHEDLGRIAHDAMSDFYLHQNARKVKDESELVELLHKMW
jgi:alcohol dehydrogenase class IV